MHEMAYPIMVYPIMRFNIYKANDKDILSISTYTRLITNLDLQQTKNV